MALLGTSGTLMSNNKGLWDKFFATEHHIKLFSAGVAFTLLGGASVGFEYAGFGVDPKFKWAFWGFGAFLVLLSIPVYQQRKKYEYLERQAKLAAFRSDSREEITLTRGDREVMDHLLKNGPMTEDQLINSVGEGEGKISYPLRYDERKLRQLWVIQKCRWLYKVGKVKIIAGVYSLRDEGESSPLTKFTDQDDF